MADKKISELTAMVALDVDNDLLPIVDTSGSETKSVTPALLMASKAPVASPTFTGVVTTPAIKLTTTPVIDYIWTCTNGDGSGGWAAAPAGGTSSLPMGHISGLALSHAADAAHDITIALGKARDATDAVDISLTSAITKAFDTTWQVGTAQGGFATGESLPASGTIHVWLIKRSDTGVVDVMANNHATTGLTPTLPSGYDYKRRIGSYRTDASANVLNGDWWGTGNIRTFMFDSPTLDIDATNPTTSAYTAAIPVPAGIIVRAVLNVLLYSDAGWEFLYISSPNNTDLAPHYSTAPLGSAYSTVGLWEASQQFVFTNAASQIRYRLNRSGGTTIYLRVSTIGWEDSI